MTERKAIELCLVRRDPRGFEHLVRQYRREAYYHALALLGNEEDAADACQDSFANAYAAMPRLKALDQFYPWFYRILRNRCLNMLGRRKTRQAYEAEQAARAKSGLQVVTTVAAVETAAEAEFVWELLRRLKPEHREVLTLKYIHGFRYDEIAATLDIPRGTVMSRLYAARNAFRQRYNQATED